MTIPRIFVSLAFVIFLWHDVDSALSGTAAGWPKQPLFSMSCMFTHASSASRSRYAVINGPLYDHARSCGSCVAIRCVDPRCQDTQYFNKSVVARISDNCPLCASSFLGVSQDTFYALTGNLTSTKINVEWAPTPCVGLVDGNIKVHFHENSSPYWFAVSIENSMEAINAVYFSKFGRNYALTRQDFNYFTYSFTDSPFTLPFELVIFSTGGSVLRVPMTSAVADSLIDTGVQFQTQATPTPLPPSRTTNEYTQEAGDFATLNGGATDQVPIVGQIVEENAWMQYSNGFIETTIRFPDEAIVELEMKGQADLNGVWPIAEISIDGHPYLNITVTTPMWSWYNFSVSDNGGDRLLKIAFINDASVNGDRNLFIQKVITSSSVPTILETPHRLVNVTRDASVFRARNVGISPSDLGYYMPSTGWIQDDFDFGATGTAQVQMELHSVYAGSTWAKVRFSIDDGLEFSEEFDVETSDFKVYEFNLTQFQGFHSVRIELINGASQSASEDGHYLFLRKVTVWSVPDSA